MPAVALNPRRDPHLRPEPPLTEPRALHLSLPGFSATPTLDCPALAQRWSVRRVLLKDEATRCGLGSFKVLGASWAVHGLVRREPRTARLVTATDGNHGRAVAWAAARLRLAADVFVPAATVAARIDAIRGEGATVHVVGGDYDDACAAAAAALDDGAALVSDTWWPGHEDVPRAVSDGYATLFQEVDEVVPAAGIDLVVVPVGVGALAAAAVRHYLHAPGSHTAVVGVEPEDAACVAASLAAGAVVSAPGPHRTTMVGLNCGTPSRVAWPAVSAGLAATVTVDNAAAEQAMRLLGTVGVAAGATGAASVAGAQRLLADPAARAVVGVDADATVLLLSTEGPTDPEHYAAVIGRGR